MFPCVFQKSSILLDKTFKGYVILARIFISNQRPVTFLRDRFRFGTFKSKEEKGNAQGREKQKKIN